MSTLDNHFLEDTISKMVLDEDAIFSHRYWLRVFSTTASHDATCSMIDMLKQLNSTLLW